MSSTGADLFFNAISALILSLFSLNQLFGLTSLIFFLAFFCFKRIKTSNHPNKIGQEKRDFWGNYAKGLKEGLAFVRQPLVRRLLFPILLMNCIYTIFYESLPEFTSLNFQTPTVYGLLLLLLRIGAMLGSGLSEFVSTCIRTGYLVVFFYSVTGLAWMLAVVSLRIHVLLLMMLLTLLSDLFNGVVNVAYSVLFQKLPPQEMIGRVHTINVTLLQSSVPLASLLGDLFVRNLGASTMMVICGASLLLLSLSLLLSSSFRSLPKIGEIGEMEESSSEV
ncbi:MFS transporter [Streptococcus sp. NLN64]|uniref:MFS transporter n=1 Tax=Streptococcus sp. NLN64 TaxID=2822799 RepID=UPI001FFCC6BF|nr:MFS transporter [Streptococcus sp. NLN64]